MSESPKTPALEASCACGRVGLSVRGAAIVCAVCYCDDCQEAGRRIEALPGAPAVLGPDGGTEYVMVRPDRTSVTRGGELLRGEKLRESSPTNRMIATCCNSAMFLRFDSGPYWFSIFRRRMANPPPLEMRLNTKFAPDPAAIPDDVPRAEGATFAFVRKLLWTRLAMAFGR